MRKQFILLVTLTTTSALNINYGIGSLLFKPSGLKVSNVSKLNKNEADLKLVEAGDFFADAFWAGKVEQAQKRNQGDAFFRLNSATNSGEVLTSKQKEAISRQQISEFRRRYGVAFAKNTKKSDFFFATNSQNELMGCCGVEETQLINPMTKVEIIAPLMSNLAVGRKFRRRGVAEELVKSMEESIIENKDGSWNGATECYLLVERVNTPAVKLYQKLGYKKVWEDVDSITLIPNARGIFREEPTVTVCMKKKLKGGGMFGIFG